MPYRKTKKGLRETMPENSLPSRRRVSSGPLPSISVDMNHKIALPVKLYFLAIAIPIYFYVGPVLMTGVRALLLVLIIPLFANLISGKYGRIILTDVVFFIFSIWSIITMFITSPDQALSYGGSVVVEFFGGYMIARAYIRSLNDFAAVCRILFLFVILTIPLAMYESQTGHPLIPELLRRLPSIESVNDFINEDGEGTRLGLERSQVVFAHPIHYGLFCSSAFSLAFVGFKHLFTNSRRILVSSLISLAVFFSLSSGAILPIVLQVGMIIWARSFHNIASRWYILLGLATAAYVTIDILSNRTPIQVFMSYATFSPHNAYWRALIFEWGMKNVWASPWVGIGLNDWFRPWFMVANSVDNFWLLIAMRFGIPGLILIALGYFTLIWRVMWKNFDGDQVLWQFRRAWVFTFLGLVMTLCTVDVWATAMSYVYFLLGSGVWFLSAKPKTSDVIDIAFIDRGRSPLAYTRFKSAPVSSRAFESNTRPQGDNLPSGSSLTLM